MKKIMFILLLAVLVACTSRGYQNTQRLVSANEMDFPQLEQRVHDHVKFKLSKLFDNGLFHEGLTIQDNGFERSIFDMGMYFSVESFDFDYMNKLRFIQEDSSDNLQLIHDYYIKKRASTLEESNVSIRKNVAKSVGFKGYFQVVNGGSYISSERQSTYFIASIAIDNKIFVFQLIGPKKNMGYFYDDFKRILNSIEK